MAETTTVVPIPPTSSALVLADDSHPLHSPLEWQVVLRSQQSQRIVLYNASRKVLSVSNSRDWAMVAHRGKSVDEDLEVITATEDDTFDSDYGETPGKPSTGLGVCPLCRQSVPMSRTQRRPRTYTAAPKNDVSYFGLLSQANSRANTPRTTRTRYSHADESEDLLDESTLNAGYYARFFQEIRKVGKGGNGTVYLVRHVLNGESLGLYACKKVTIGAKSGRLPDLLREIQILETLQHDNLITYHHSWAETASLSAYGPSVPTLHILMQFANGGSLEQFIAQRKGDLDSAGGGIPSLSKEERVRRHKLRSLGAVHLLRLEEITAIFSDITRGLQYLHNRNILHLDLKAENVLLHWEDDGLLPVAKISDLGSSDLLYHADKRKSGGHYGTLEWLPPESLQSKSKSRSCTPSDKATDLWSLGLILHLLAFFTLPYRNTEYEALEQEIKNYPGFSLTDAENLDHGKHIPTSVLNLISRLVNRQVSKRPSCLEVLRSLDEIAKADFEISVANASAVIIRDKTPSPALMESVVATMKPSSETPTKHFSKELVPKSDRINASSKRSARQAGLIVLIILKTMAVQAQCTPSSPRMSTTWILLVLAVTELWVGDLRVAAMSSAAFVLVTVSFLSSSLCCVQSIKLDEV